MCCHGPVSTLRHLFHTQFKVQNRDELCVTQSIKHIMLHLWNKSAFFQHDAWNVQSWLVFFYFCLPIAGKLNTLKNNNINNDYNHSANQFHLFFLLKLSFPTFHTEMTSVKRPAATSRVYYSCQCCTIAVLQQAAPLHCAAQERVSSEEQQQQKKASENAHSLSLTFGERAATLLMHKVHSFNYKLWNHREIRRGTRFNSPSFK